MFYDKISVYKKMSEEDDNLLDFRGYKCLKNFGRIHQKMYQFLKLKK